MVLEQGTITMSHYSVQSSSRLMQSELFLDCHWKEKSVTSFGIFARETVRASRRTLL